MGICPACPDLVGEQHRDDGTFRPCRKGSVLTCNEHALLYDAARGFARVGRALRSQFPAPGVSKARLYPCAIIALAAFPSAEKATQE